MKALATVAGWVILASTLGLGVASSACGGHAALDDLGGDGGTGGGGDGGGGGGGGDGGGGGGGGDGGGGGVTCPSSPPSQGGSCASTELVCEYGSDPNMQCNTVARCTLSGWQLDVPGKSLACPSPGAGKGCPESFGGVPQGQSCSPAGLECGYPQGRCACSFSFGPVPADGGGGTWSCEAPQAGCPHPRPRLGSACTQPSSLSCDYGTCTLPGGLGMQCQGGIWVQEMSACPAYAK